MKIKRLIKELNESKGDEVFGCVCSEELIVYKNGKETKRIKVV